LDEITVDLDLLSRHNFLQFLKRETESRSCTIVYATHILDNLANWPSHLVHMSLGKIKKWGPIDSFEVPATDGGEEGNSRLGQLVMTWLQADLEERGPRKGQKAEGMSYQSHEGKGGYGQEHIK
jgi:CCR4-NOT complex subunit CAF16